MPVHQIWHGTSKVLGTVEVEEEGLDLSHDCERVIWSTSEIATCLSGQLLLGGAVATL